MKSLFTLLTAALFSFSLLCSCIKDEEPDEVQNYITEGMKVPTFTLDDGEGNTFSSARFVGKKSLLVFMNTTCPDCKREMPKVEAVWQALQEESDCQVLAVGRGESKKNLDAYWKEGDYTLDKYPDPERSVYNLFANSYIPRFYLIDSSGIVKWMAIENLDVTVDELIEKIKSLS